MELSKIFKYDPSSPSHLSWLVSTNKRISVGSPVGGINGEGYYKTRFKGKPIFVHRLIWEMFNGPIGPEMYIDHIDGNRTNNNILNLRVGSREVNARNYSLRVDNTSGVKGVRRIEEFAANGSCYLGWKAFWNELDGSYRGKTFGINKYGEDEAFRLACEYREKMIQKLNDQGAGYTERHTS